MKFKADLPLSSQIASAALIWFISTMSGVSVFSVAILLQWLIYDDWMHRNGPLRLVGSALASALTFGFVYLWQLRARRQKIEILRRFERIKWMNDRIRNSLQAIECVVYATNPHVTDPVKIAVDAIERVLQEVLTESHPDLPTQGKELPVAQFSVKNAPRLASPGEPM